jgi:hypothetical protein
MITLIWRKQELNKQLAPFFMKKLLAIAPVGKREEAAKLATMLVAEMDSVMASEFLELDQDGDGKLSLAEAMMQGGAGDI